MSDDELDPGANTEMFQAFMDRPQPEASGSRWTGVALAVAVVVGLVIVAAIAWLLLRG